MEIPSEGFGFLRRRQSQRERDRRLAVPLGFGGPDCVYDGFDIPRALRYIPFSRSGSPTPT